MFDGLFFFMDFPRFQVGTSFKVLNVGLEGFNCYYCDGYIVYISISVIGKILYFILYGDIFKKTKQFFRRISVIIAFS